MSALAFASRAPGVELPADVRLMHAAANVLLALAAAVLLALALGWIVRQPGFALHRITIEGDVARNSLTTIRANAAPKLSGNFFTTDLAAGRRAFESVPWVRKAVVRRVWPDRLAVRLEEHRPAAVWAGNKAEDKLVNTFGEVFQANLGDVEDDSLPVLDGPEGSSAQMLAMLGRLGPVFATQSMRIERLSLSDRGSWRAALDSGAEVELGRGSDDEVVARTERFAATLTQVTGRFQRPLEYADLRHQDGYAVRLEGITTVNPGEQKKQGR